MIFAKTKRLVKIHYSSWPIITFVFNGMYDVIKKAELENDFLKCKQTLRNTHERRRIVAVASKFLLAAAIPSFHHVWKSACVPIGQQITDVTEHVFEDRKASLDRASLLYFM